MAPVHLDAVIKRFDVYLFSNAAEIILITIAPGLQEVFVIRLFAQPTGSMKKTLGFEILFVQLSSQSVAGSRRYESAKQSRI